MLHGAVMQCTSPATLHMQSHSIKYQLQGRQWESRWRRTSDFESVADELMVEHWLVTRCCKWISYTFFSCRVAAWCSKPERGERNGVRILNAAKEPSLTCAPIKYIIMPRFLLLPLDGSRLTPIEQTRDYGSVLIWPWTQPWEYSFRRRTIRILSLHIIDDIQVEALHPFRLAM